MKVYALAEVLLKVWRTCLAHSFGYTPLSWSELKVKVVSYGSSHDIWLISTYLRADTPVSVAHYNADVRETAFWFQAFRQTHSSRTMR